ncbi:MAG: FAD-dependent oxidoreductase [Bacteroidota bacterium]|nr:FAD-dependent oxidoreductase [Bacteroidota bacterium]MDP4212318.1 FAD-dependent oxidoreductase [Bacteroidota bacterium]
MNELTHADVLVLGGGASGIAAAVAAAKAGLQVALIERNPFLGGLATAAEVGTICGLYKFSKKESSEYIAGRFAKDFAECLKIKSGTKPLFNPSGLHYLPYHIEAFKKLCSDLLDEHKVKRFLNTELYSLSRSDTKIESVSVNTEGESFRFTIGSVIDCSGDGLLSQLADLPLIKSEHYQAAAQVFTLQNLNETDESILGLVLMKELRRAIKEKKLALYFDRVYVIPGSLTHHCVSIKIGLPLDVTHAPENLHELKRVAHTFIHELTGYLIQHVPVFKNASVLHIAPQVGIRVGLRTTGRYILTEEDVLQCKKFEDGIANVSWPIEEWEQDRRVKIRYLKEDDFYQIPARCLQSNTMDNLFTAGKCISATDAAIASARVMGVCLQTGYSAGFMAAASALNTPLADTIKQIREREL